MKFPLYNLHDREFEELTGSICSMILGIGTVVFSEGKDGGRDGKFEGKANSFPSLSSPWCGKFIIQSKFTSKPNASCSDSDFIRIMSEERKKVIALKTAKLIDNYIVFTNRKLTGLQDPKLEADFKSDLDINYSLIGLEKIDLLLREYPEVSKRHNLNRLLMPLEFYETDIRDTIIEFSKTSFLKDDLDSVKAKFLRIPIEEKNRINGLSEAYFNDVLKHSYQEFNKIELFLSDPANVEYSEKFLNTVEDLQEKITVKRDDFGAFDEVLAFLYDRILDEREIVLLNKRRLIRFFLHYMYASCFIGKKVNTNVVAN